MSPEGPLVFVPGWHTGGGALEEALGEAFCSLVVYPLRSLCDSGIFFLSLLFSASPWDE